MVRRKIGFADEDPVERKRVADLLAFQAERASSGSFTCCCADVGTCGYALKLVCACVVVIVATAVEMIVHTIDGQIERVKLDGQSSFAEAYAAAAHDRSTPAALGAFEFVDAAPGSTSLDNSTDVVAATKQDVGPRSLQNIIERESDDKYSIRVANSVRDLWSLEPAEWAKAAQQESSPAAVADVEASKPRKKAAATKKPKAKSAAEIEKEAAQQKIAELQLYLQQLEEEKVSGTRSIDDIDQDIASAKAEITQLKRKYINWFYFF